MVNDNIPLGKVGLRKPGPNSLADPLRFTPPVEHSHRTLCELGVDGIVVSAHREGGFASDHGALAVGASYLRGVWESDRPFVVQRIEAAARGESSEFNFRTPSGRRMQASLIPLSNSDGTTARVIAVTVDSDACRSPRDRREDWDAELGAFIEKVPVLIAVFDSKGNIALWNPECERVTGYSAEDVARHPHLLEMLRPRTDTPERQENAPGSRGGGIHVPGSEIVCKDGSRKTIAWSTVSVGADVPGGEILGLGMDITEWARAERALRDSEEILRSVTDSSPDILAVVDLEGTLRFINRPAPDWTWSEVIGTSIWNYVPPKYRSQMEECFRRVGDTGEIRQVELEYETRDRGRIIPYELRVGSIKRDGRVDGFAISATDLTDRRGAEARFRAHYKNLPIPTYTYQWGGDDLVLVDFNDAGYDSTKGIVARFLGKTCKDIYGEDSGVAADLRGCFHHRATTRREYRHRFRTTGEVHDLDVTYVFVPPDGVVAHVDVIDGRKTAEEALRRSEERLAQSQRIARIGNWDWDIVARKTEWSDEVYRVLGLQPHEVEAGYETFLECVHADDRESLKLAVETALRTGEPYTRTFRIRRPDGDERVLYTQAEVTADDQGRPLRMLGTVQDITVQYRAEQQLKAALEEKETLLREVHHRVKNNLQVISSLLFLQSQKATDPALTRMFDEMEWRVKTMALIHENLYQSTDMVRVDFRRYLQMLVEGLTSAHAGRPVRLATRLDDVSLEIHTAVPCGLIVNELVTNAFLHAFKDGAEGVIRVEFSECDGRLELLVRDDGVGLPADAQLNQSASLGLRLVHNLTEQIGGELKVDRDRGTSFLITFSA